MITKLKRGFKMATVKRERTQIEFYKRLNLVEI